MECSGLHQDWLPTGQQVPGGVGFQAQQNRRFPIVSTRLLKP